LDGPSFGIKSSVRTLAPERQHHAEIRAIHDAVAVDVSLREYLIARSPETEKDAEVRAIDDAVVGRATPRCPAERADYRIVMEPCALRAARAVRALGWDDAEDVLAPLAEDSYEDDNGYCLVREAAGFTD